MSLATAEAIRDQLYNLVERITPSSLTTPFRRYRNEEGADFVAWAEKNPAAALRRFQVREVGDDVPPETSNTTEERVRLRLEIRIAYPQTQRYGKEAAMDRDDVINADWKAINWAIGLYGRGNFSSGNDCTPLGAVKARETGSGVDFMVITADYEYLRSTT